MQRSLMIESAASSNIISDVTRVIENLYLEDSEEIIKTISNNPMCIFSIFFYLVWKQQRLTKDKLNVSGGY